jgi:hypothetical protein
VRAATSYGPNRAARRAAAATWGDPTPPSAERPRMKLIGWKPIRKGDLAGFAPIVLPIGLKIVDCPVLVSRGEAWAMLPSKPQIDKDGRHKTDADGRPAYSPVIEWRDRALADRFSAALVALVRAEHAVDLESAQ